MNISQSTIAAIITPRGTGGIAAIRLSGSESWAIARSLMKSQQAWSANQICHDWLIDPEDQQIVDEVLILPFQAPRSFTGEDCVEIHCHGGLVTSQFILKLCLKAGAQMAAPGEFTKKALLHGRIDLTQAESILDLIHAQGERLVKIAASNLHHRTIGHRLMSYLERISDIQADLTASIDFPDEVEEPDRQTLAKAIYALKAEIQQDSELSRRNQVIRDGLEIALVGMPNAGKSSLFNALLSADRSIVTEIPGTTRDVIREALTINGIPVVLCDTAGLRDTKDTVEAMGVERSWQAVDTAHAVIYVVDGTQGLTNADDALLEKFGGKPGVLAVNKADSPVFRSTQLSANDWPVLETSATNRIGLRAILDWIESLMGTMTDLTGLEHLLSEQQLEKLDIIDHELQDAVTSLEATHIPLDLATIPLTNALLALEGLLGHDTTEKVLDSVFSRFCVGK